MNKKYVCYAKLIEKKWLNSSYFTLRFYCPDIALNCFPGQFVNLKLSELYDPLLRRPMSIFKCNKEEKWIEFLLKVVGKGTFGFSTVKTGDRFGLLGPLGNNYNFENVNSAVLVGGGIGIAPLIFLAEELSKNDIEIFFIQGFRSKDELCCLDEIAPMVNHLIVTTDDGSYGKKGDVAIAFQNIISEQPTLSKSTVFACGPNPMMASLEKICMDQDIMAQFSVEAHMACGFGVCVGCPIPIRDGSGYYLACVDGPVFNSGEVKFE